MKTKISIHEDEDSDLIEDTLMVLNTQNNEQMDQSLFQKTLNTVMEKNEDSEKIVLNLTFDDKKGCRLHVRISQQSSNIPRLHTVDGKCIR